MKYTHISEGGKARNFSARKLRTKLSGGGTCLWVPSDTVVRASKNISENGEYTAANEGIYAYEQINVSRYVNKICGNKNGVPYIAYSSNGQIYEQELPTEIRVTTNPTKTQYQNGEYVDYTGIVVKAYDSNGNLWTNSRYPNGVIPNNELNMPILRVDYDALDDIVIESDVLASFLSNEAKVYYQVPPFTGLSTFKIIKNFEWYIKVDKETYTFSYYRKFGISTDAHDLDNCLKQLAVFVIGDIVPLKYVPTLLLFASKEENTDYRFCNYTCEEYYVKSTGKTQKLEGFNKDKHFTPQEVTYDGKTAYTMGGALSFILNPPGAQGGEVEEAWVEGGDNIQQEGNDFIYDHESGYPTYGGGSGGFVAYISWAMFYSPRAVYIEWPRYGDKKVLKTFFPLTIEE